MSAKMLMLAPIADVQTITLVIYCCYHICFDWLHTPLRH